MSKKYVGYGIVRYKCLILNLKLSYNMNKNLTFTFFLLLWGQIIMTAQKYNSPFKAGVTIGINQAQIDGDEQFGYKRRGNSKIFSLTAHCLKYSTILMFVITVFGLYFFNNIHSVNFS